MFAPSPFDWCVHKRLQYHHISRTEKRNTLSPAEAGGKGCALDAIPSRRKKRTTFFQ